MTLADLSWTKNVEKILKKKKKKNVALQIHSDRNQENNQSNFDWQNQFIGSIFYSSRFPVSSNVVFLHNKNIIEFYL